MSFIRKEHAVLMQARRVTAAADKIENTAHLQREDEEDETHRHWARRGPTCPFITNSSGLDSKQWGEDERSQRS